MPSTYSSSKPRAESTYHTVPLLGDVIQTALHTVGITKERVMRWLGKPCRCSGKQEQLNALDAWARMTVKNKLDQAKQALESLIEEA